MILLSLQSRIFGAIVGVLIVSLLIVTIFLGNRAKNELESSVEDNAINLLLASKNVVESQYNSVIYHKNFVLSRRKIELKNKVSIVYSAINFIYEDYKNGFLTELEAKERAKDIIRSAYYDKDVGYFWINDCEKPIPNMIMHPFLPKLTGKRMDDSIYFHGKGKHKNIGQAFVEACTGNGEGYVEYLWPKPGIKGEKELKSKMSYVVHFKPWDWIIGSGVYIDDIERDFQTKINSVIENLNSTLINLRIGESGYFFIFNENKQMLVHPSIAGKDVSDIMNPATGKLLFDEMREVALKNENYKEYNWDKPGFEGQYIFPKKAFVTYFEPLGWYIASSVYEDEFEHEIKGLIKTIILFSLSFLIIAFVVSLLIAKGIIRPLNLLIASIKKTDHNGLPDMDSLKSTNIPEIELLNLSIKRMINSVRRSKNELKSERDFSLDLINTTPDFICGIGRNGITNFVNPAIQKITGYNIEELIGKNWWKIFKPSNSQLSLDEIVSLISAKEIANLEITMLNKESEKISIVWNSFIRKDNDTSDDIIIGFGNDITDRKIAEHNLLLEKERAEESSRLKSAFLSNISHEVRTPLNGIIGFSSLLKAPNIEAEERNECINYIERSGDRLLNVISDIVEISKIETSKIKVFNNEINIASELNKIYTESLEIYKERDIQLGLKTDLDDGNLVVNSDLDKFRAIFRYLMNNAFKFCREGNILIGCNLENNYIRFFVKDTGIGVPKNKLDSIFERFVQGDVNNVSFYEGTGLGLAISKAYVELLNGEIWMESEEGKGTQVYFTIPYN